MTGIAWEVGVLAGLLDAGIDLRDSDAIIGTSAGSFVGAAVASGYDVERLFSAQLEPDGDEVAIATSNDLSARWATAFETGGSDPGEGRRRVRRDREGRSGTGVADAATARR